MNSTQKKILITGITGMVGSHLADHIIKFKPNWKIYGCCRWRSDVDNINHLFQEKIYKDKHKVLLHYLPNQTTKKLTNYEYVNNPESLFLNDRLLCVHKNTGKIYQQGIIIKITKQIKLIIVIYIVK